MEGEKGGDMVATKEMGRGGEGCVQGQFKTNGSASLGLKASSGQAMVGIFRN